MAYLAAVGDGSVTDEIFLVWGKRGNASCIVAPWGAVCETPVRLGVGPFRPLDNVPVTDEI